MKERKNSGFYSNYILDLYLTLSFFCSGLWLIFYFYLRPDFFYLGLYPSLLFFGTAYFFMKIDDSSLLLKQAKGAPLLFWGQFSALIGTGLSYENVGPLYASITPIFAAFYFFHFIDRGEVKKNQSMQEEIIFWGLVACSIVGMSSNYDISFIKVEDWVFMLGSLFWSVGLVYIGGKLVQRERRLLLRGILRKQNMSFKGEDEDRFFFHDLINLTHGIGLFLEHKVKQKCNLKTAELLELKEEVKTVELLAKDHFGMTHKNLTEISDYVSLEKIKESIDRMLDNYLPKSEAQCHFIMGETLKKLQNKDYFHYPSLNRIFLNLIKNISEIESTEVEFHFIAFESHLDIIIKNRIFKLEGDRKNLLTNLNDIIYKSEFNGQYEQSRVGLGLESISGICEKIGAEFTFSIEDGLWVTNLSIPYQNHNEICLKKAS